MLIAAYFWDKYFVNMSYNEMTKCLIEHNLIPKHTDIEAFRRKLNRIGLKKSRYNKKQDK